MKQILITGSNGFIANSLSKKINNYNLTLTNRLNLNLLHQEQVNNFFKNKHFDTIIHTAVSGGKRIQEDNKAWIYENLLMMNNLMANHKSFDKIISFGSGAELDRNKNIDEFSKLSNSFPTDPYGLSKNIIAKLYLNENKFYNIRIFNVFDYDELDTRMIKSSLLNYLNKKPIIIHQNKLMDFFYMEDLHTIISYIIENDNFPRQINCSYKNKLSLLDIAEFINNLENYKVDIIIENEAMANSYYGKYNIPSNINLIGCKSGIKNIYKILKEIK